MYQPQGDDGEVEGVLDHMRGPDVSEPEQEPLGVSGVGPDEHDDDGEHPDQQEAPEQAGATTPSEHGRLRYGCW